MTGSERKKEWPLRSACKAHVGQGRPLCMHISWHHLRWFNYHDLIADVVIATSSTPLSWYAAWLFGATQPLFLQIYLLYLIWSLSYWMADCSGKTCRMCKEMVIWCLLCVTSSSNVQIPVFYVRIGKRATFVSFPKFYWSEAVNLEFSRFIKLHHKNT